LKVHSQKEEEKKERGGKEGKGEGQE